MPGQFHPALCQQRRRYHAVKSLRAGCATGPARYSLPAHCHAANSCSATSDPTGLPDAAATCRAGSRPGPTAPTLPAVHARRCGNSQSRTLPISAASDRSGHRRRARSLASMRRGRGTAVHRCPASKVPGFAQQRCQPVGSRILTGSTGTVRSLSTSAPRRRRRRANTAPDTR